MARKRPDQVHYFKQYYIRYKNYKGLTPQRVGGCPSDSATTGPTVLEAKDKSEYICSFLFVKCPN